MRRKKLFALDQNFPESILKALAITIPEAELRPLRVVDRRLMEFEDWEIFLALHHHPERWDGLITTDAAILTLPRELSTIKQTKLTLVVSAKSGHDPLRATGILLTHLPHICRLTRSDKPQVWSLSASNKAPERPWDFLKRLADRDAMSVEEYFEKHRLKPEEFDRDPLA